MANLIDRIQAKTKKVPAPKHARHLGHCFVWTGQLDRDGYGIISINSTPALVHRVAWASVRGEPGNLCVLHKCDNRACWRTSHLFLGTRRDNAQDKVSKGRMLRGDDCPYTKLRDRHIKQLLSDFRAGASRYKLAEKYGISHGYVCRLILYGVRRPVKYQKRNYKKQGKRNREKGKRYERDCVKALRSVYPNCRRLFGQARKGCDAPDIGGTPFWVECGFGSTTVIREKLLQGLRDTADCEDPRYMRRPVIAMTCTSKGEHIVSMTRDEFISLVKSVEAAWEILEKN